MALLPVIMGCWLVPVSASETVELSSQERTLRVSRVLEGLKNPWSIAFIDSDHWLVTERNGQLRQVKQGVLLKQPVSGLPDIAAGGQGGLLDVVLHPGFSENRRLYLSYAAAGKGGSGTEVGDRGERGSAQDTMSHAGSIIRLRDDGSVPADNPFVDDNRFHPEIFSTGHRNVQGMLYDPSTDTLWAHEHGPQGGDELNRVIAGNNYGWPVITYGANYGSGSPIGEGTAKSGMQQPETYWDPSIAPSGLVLVSGNRYPEWQGNLLVGALKYQLIARLVIENGKVVEEERLLEGQFGRIRDVRLGPDGFIYFLTDSNNGAIYRIE